MVEVQLTEADLMSSQDLVSSQDLQDGPLDDISALERDKLNTGEDQIRSSKAMPASWPSSSASVSQFSQVSEASNFGSQDYNANSPFELNPEELRTMVYPVNMERRDYQENIVRKAVMKNVLCALPTGLGKTFIASAVMLNYYRWTKNAKVIFMAPTRPLVSQQIEAALGIAGIPKSDATVMIGSSFGPAMRKDEWDSKRVIFATPQIVGNDLRNGLLDARSIACIVVDEAHRSTGNSAYVNVIKQITETEGTMCRILALTATPGSTAEAVQEVINNLHINTCEIRTEESIDIRQYVHKRTETHVEIERTPLLEEIIQHFTSALEPKIDYLQKVGGLRHINTDRLSNYPFFEGSRKFAAANRGAQASGRAFAIKAQFMLMIKLGRAMELLRLHGIRPFYDSIIGYVNEQKSKGSKMGKTAKELLENEDFIQAMKLAKSAIYEEDSQGKLIEKPGFMGHGKLIKMVEIVNGFFTHMELTKDERQFKDIQDEPELEQDFDVDVDSVDNDDLVETNFRSAGNSDNGVVDLTLSDLESVDDDNDYEGRKDTDNGGPKNQKRAGSSPNQNTVSPSQKRFNSKIIIFCQYRDSAAEIIRVLNEQCRAFARPHIFVGQATSNGAKGMRQKEQQDIIDRFKKGDINILVATSIGEEGLDIGQVDLIIFYDTSRSAIRNVQRMGRTGRQRDGKVYKLLSDEEKSRDNYASKGYTYIQNQINRTKHFTYLPVRDETRLLRKLPTVVYKEIEIPEENHTLLEMKDDKHDAATLLSQVITQSKKRKQKTAALPKKTTTKKPKKVFEYPKGVELGIQSARTLLESNNLNNMGDETI